MIRKINKNEVKNIVGDVFSTDEDFYLRRYHGKNKSLDGIKDYVYDVIYNSGTLEDVNFYVYGENDIEGYFAINNSPPLLRSFGIKKQYRNNGKNDLFWKSVRSVLGNNFNAVIWKENKNARRFFENEGAVLELDKYNCYNFKFK